MNNEKYAKRLLDNTDETKVKKVTLQLNLEITEKEAVNLNKLIEILRKSSESVTKKSICYGALKDSGIFDNIL